MPGTPTYTKAVHFDSHLEHVRHFLQVDRPLAVSVGSSPVENYNSEVGFPFGYDESERPHQQPFVWAIRLSNFRTYTQEHKSLPVRVERVFLSSDNKNLVGAIAVQNLAFQKLVVARFTLDYWKTTSEVIADYNHDVLRRQNDGCDSFSFSIKLVDLANLENKTMFFCIRYSVNGQDYWDNNNGINYRVDFTKEAKPQHDESGIPGIGARPLDALPSAWTSPITLADSFDDFPVEFNSYSSFNRSSLASIVDDLPIKLKTPRPRTEIGPGAPTWRNKGQTFGRRYDFDASLSAAIRESGLKSRLDTNQSSSLVPASGSGPPTSDPQSLYRPRPGEKPAWPAESLLA
jgi:hypothetical protein